jgi:hypothetical protein
MGMTTVRFFLRLLKMIRFFPVMSRVSILEVDGSDVVPITICLRPVLVAKSALCTFFDAVTYIALYLSLFRECF